MTEPTYKLAIIPGHVLASVRHAITEATGCQVTEEANAIIQATLDCLAAQPAVPAMLMTNAMRAELVDDTAATFYANGPETPQVVRDVIQYVDSWLQVQLGRAQDAAQANQAAPDALQAANAARIQAQMEVVNLKERLASARMNLMTELREHGWTPPYATPMAARLREAEARLYDMALGDDGQAWSEAYRECCGNAVAVYLTGQQVLELLNKRRQEIVAELQKLEGGEA